MKSIFPLFDAFSVLLLILFGIPGGVFANFKYVEYRFDAAQGSLESVGHQLRHFEETPANLSEWGVGYFVSEKAGLEELAGYSIFRYEFYLGAYFHVVFDENGILWGKAPTGFGQFF